MKEVLIGKHVIVPSGEHGQVAVRQDSEFEDVVIVDMWGHLGDTRYYSIVDLKFYDSTQTVVMTDEFKKKFTDAMLALYFAAQISILNADSEDSGNRNMSHMVTDAFDKIKADAEAISGYKFDDLEALARDRKQAHP